MWSFLKALWHSNEEWRLFLHELCISNSLFQHQQMHVRTMWNINWHLPSAGLSSAEVDWRKVENCPLCLRIHISDFSFWKWWTLVWLRRKRTMQGLPRQNVLWWSAVVLYYIQWMCCYMVVEWLFKSLALAKHSIFNLYSLAFNQLPVWNHRNHLKVLIMHVIL